MKLKYDIDINNKDFILAATDKMTEWLEFNGTFRTK